MNVVQLPMTGLVKMRQDEQRHDGHSPSAPWAGFAEIDRAIVEDRLTAYRWRKAWADPLSRYVIVLVVLVLVSFAAFVVAYDGFGWR